MRTKSVSARLVVVLGSVMKSTEVVSVVVSVDVAGDSVAGVSEACGFVLMLSAPPELHAHRDAARAAERIKEAFLYLKVAISALRKTILCLLFYQSFRKCRKAGLCADIANQYVNNSNWRELTIGIIPVRIKKEILKMKKTRITALLLGVAMLLSASGCSSAEKETEAVTAQPSATSENATEEESAGSSAEAVTEPLTDYLSGHATFELTSEDLQGGVWADVISNTNKGENVSPQLSWAPVEGASSYVIIMVDTSVKSWVHWISDNVTETELPGGWAPSSDYIGPYPPSGDTHVYEIYVVALRAPVEKVKCAFNATNPKFETAITNLDTDADGNEGNIIAFGHIAGKFTS